VDLVLPPEEGGRTGEEEDKKDRKGREDIPQHRFWRPFLPLCCGEGRNRSDSGIRETAGTFKGLPARFHSVFVLRHGTVSLGSTFFEREPDLLRMTGDSVFLWGDPVFRPPVGLGIVFPVENGRTHEFVLDVRNWCVFYMVRERNAKRNNGLVMDGGLYALNSLKMGWNSGVAG
jgi:hypothetical protein